MAKVSKEQDGLDVPMRYQLLQLDEAGGWDDVERYSILDIEMNRINGICHGISACFTFPIIYDNFLTEEGNVLVESDDLEELRWKSAHLFL